MSNKNYKINVFIFFFSILFLLSACNSPVESNNNDNYDEDISSILKEMESGDLSPAELDGLVFMREEEKLARDVYTVLFKTWNQKIFSNISKSEERHTNAIKVLLEKYDIEDPVVNDEIGVFVNSNLQTLYDNLVERGNSSLIEAFKVGAAIEEIDILDLERNLELVDNEDIKFAYENLLRGSRNHLRAFVRNLNAQGVEYSAQYMDQGDFMTIISSDMEKGNKKGKRKGKGQR